MQFTSIAFIVALAAFILIYYLVPNRLKNVLLLIVCYAFYAAFGFRYIFLLLGSTALTYFSGICFSENKGETGGKYIYTVKAINGIIVSFCDVNGLAIDLSN